MIMIQNIGLFQIGGGVSDVISLQEIIPRQFAPVTPSKQHHLLLIAHLVPLLSSFEQHVFDLKLPVAPAGLRK